MKVYVKFQVIIACTSILVFLHACKRSESSSPESYVNDTILKPMNIYFGNLHGHTNDSDGSITPAESFTWARDVAKMDFYAITDHAEKLVSWEWYNIGLHVQKYNEDGKFVAMRGFEYSSLTNEHINVFCTVAYVNSMVCQTENMLYEWLNVNNGYAQLNHPGYGGRNFNNLEYVGTAAEKIVAIETGNASDGNNTGIYINYYDTALNKGWKLGPTNNLDNHEMLDYKHRTAILAERLTSESLFSSFKARRFYSTDDPDIKIKYYYKSHWLGSFVKDTGNITLNVDVEDNEPIRLIKLITNKGMVADSLVINNSVTNYLWKPIVHITGKAFFYVKVISQNLIENDLPEQIAVTSPIWFNY